MSYRNYGANSGFVVDANGHGDFKTITAALAAATSGMTIYVNPGSYTENLTLVTGVTIASSDAYISATIIGTCSYSSSGQTRIVGMTLQTNGSNVIQSTGSGQVFVKNCTLSYTDATGLSQSGSGRIFLENSLINAGTQVPFSVSNGSLLFYYCVLNSTNTGTVSGGYVQLNYCDVYHSISTSGTGGFASYYSNFSNDSGQLALSGTGTGGGIVGFGAKIIKCYFYGNGATWVAAGTSVNVYIADCDFVAAGNACITSASGSVVYIMNCTFYCTATDVITEAGMGNAGTVNVGYLTFSGSGSGINANLTKNNLTVYTPP